MMKLQVLRMLLVAPTLVYAQEGSDGGGSNFGIIFIVFIICLVVGSCVCCVTGGSSAQPHEQTAANHHHTVANHHHTVANHHHTAANHHADATAHAVTHSNDCSGAHSGGCSNI
jgi:ABC-type nickel/cobalt efflux system permease component RcnA